MKIYIAAPLFSEGERAFNEKVETIVRECGHEVFLPQKAGGCVADLPDIIEGLPKRKYLFRLDCEHLDWCDMILFLLDGRVPDEGACFELGYCFAKGKRCVGYKTDARSFIDGYENVMLHGSLEVILRNENELREYLRNPEKTAGQRARQKRRVKADAIHAAAGRDEKPEEPDDSPALTSAERVEKQLSENMDMDSEKKPDLSDPKDDPVKEIKPETDTTDQKTAAGKPALTDLRQYGEIMLLLTDERRRKIGYAALEKMISRFPEAGVALGQYYSSTDQDKAKKYFRIAADSGIHEGEWGYACMLPHSVVPDQDNPDDVQYETYCLRAAEGGCPDAANEMGNICHRRDCLAEAAYWYGMAFFLEHPHGIKGVQGIIRKWENAGKPEEYIAGTANYTEERHKAAICFLRAMTGENMLDDLMALCLAGDTLAGLAAAYFFEQAEKDRLAYKAYIALASGNHPHVLRCYADMLLYGKGIARDINSAYKMYEQAAYEGNAVSLYALGERALKDGDICLAAACFGQANSRGMEKAGDMLASLADMK